MISITMLRNRAETLYLFFGDVLILYFALFLTLLIRYGSSAFDFKRMFFLHVVPFSVLFLIWTIVFFIAGLYEKHTLFLQKELPQLLSRSLMANVIIAVLFFYFIPAFKITPRINLFICLFVASTLLFFWRRYSLQRPLHGEREHAIIIGSGEEMWKIIQEINHNPHYRIGFNFSIDTSASQEVNAEGVITRILAEKITLVVVDMDNSKTVDLLPHLYDLLFNKVQFVDMYKIYENIFDRIPVSIIQYNWFLENISHVSLRSAYDFLKRIMDSVISLSLSILSLPLYPLIYAAIKLDDGGPLLVFQERVGLGNKIIRTIKFRTMALDDAGLEDLKRENKTTRIGAFLRKTRIDELPQLLNVFKGEMSLIGPRPELPALVKVYEREVPHYNIRHLIKPGLSGWAQLYHKTPPKVDANSIETEVKLSYDLYYLKNRSFWLDIKIALKTIKVLLSRSGV